MAGLESQVNGKPKLQTIFAVSHNFLLPFIFLAVSWKAGECWESTHRAGREGQIEDDVKLTESAWGLMSSNIVRRTSPALRRHDSFVEFYTGLSAADVDKQTVQTRYSQVVDKIKLSRRREIALSEDPRQDGPVSVTDRLYSAVNHGRLPDADIVSFGSSTGVKSYWMEIRREINPSGSFLEIGDCVTAFQIAADHPNITVIAVVTSDTNVPFCLDNADSGGMNNFNLGIVESGDLEDIVEQLYSDPQVMFGTVFLSNLTQLADGLLPHELEEMVARVVSLAPHALIMNSHLGDMMNFFTSQWASPKALLQKSCERAGLDCVIDAPYSGAVWKTIGTVYKVRVTQGARDLPAPVCNTLTNRSDCVLLYNDDSSRAVIQAADGKTFPFSLNYSTVALDVLLKLNPVLNTKEKLFRLMLRLPQSIEMNGLVHKLSISGGRLTLSHPRTEHYTRDISELTNKALPTHVQMVVSKGENSLLKGRVDTEELSVKNSMRNPDLGDEEDLWLREDNSHIDNELDKDRVWSDRIDSLWAREGRAKTAVKGQGAGFKAEPDVYQRLSQEEEEPGMTRDEQELQQAIGFLYGEPDSKQSAPKKSDKRTDAAAGYTPAVSTRTEPSFQSFKVVDKTHGPELKDQNSKLQSEGRLVFQFTQHDPQEAGRRHESQATARRHEPQDAVRRHGPQHTADRHKPQEAADKHEPQEAAWMQEPQEAAQKNELKEAAGRHEQRTGAARSPAPQEIISPHEAAPSLDQPPEQNLHIDRQMKEDMGREVKRKEEMLNFQKGSVTISPRPAPRSKKHRVRGKKFSQQGTKAGQRKLLMVDPTVLTPYMSKLEEHAAQLRLQSAARQSGTRSKTGRIQSDSNALTQTMMSKIRVEDYKNGTYSGLLAKVIEDSKGRASTARPFHHAFTHHKSSHQRFDHYWRILRPLFVEETERADAHFNLLTCGDESQSLLGLKVASSFPASTVVSIMSSIHQTALASHRKSMKVLKRENYMLLLNDIAPDVLTDLQRLPELFRFQIMLAVCGKVCQPSVDDHGFPPGSAQFTPPTHKICQVVLGVEIFTKLLLLRETFLFYLGHWLLLARTTILEVPHPELLLQAYASVQPDHQENTAEPIVKGFIEEAVRLVGGTVQNIQILTGVHHHGYRAVSQRRLVRVDIGTLQRRVFVDCGKASGDLQLRSGGVAYLSHLTDKKEFVITPIGRAGSGVGLEFILQLGPSAPERKALFRKYLSLPVHPDMCPHHVVYFNQTFIYHPVTTSSTQLSSSSLLPQGEADQTQLLMQMLSSELGPEPFSFMEYNSRKGLLISSLTAKYRNSTFVSLQEEKAAAEQLYKELKAENLHNLAICVLHINREFTQKMVKSPDFLRYQFISSVEFLKLMKKNSRPEFNHLLGEILATSVTSFVQVPSAVIFSLAMTTFFQDEDDDNLFGNSPIEYKKKFMRENHPLKVYEGAELKFLRESAQANVNVTISAEVVSLSGVATSLPWRVIRVDVMNLSVQVDHHFDYSLDGHSRKYQQHCVARNKTSYDVFLIREQDGFKIPYGNLHAISLIALLRMGILQDIKSDFYDKFLQLPLYEDMAPWNIVFQAGHLDYIDYDSKDVTFDRMAPAAYQILAMLMNYERTVKDFGHCNEHAKNPYQFKLISNCVGNSGFDGPCTDSRFPVPCGDHTCRSTYIECLQALNHLEKHKSTVRNTVYQGRSHPEVKKSALSDLNLVQQEWVHNFANSRH